MNTVRVRTVSMLSSALVFLLAAQTFAQGLTAEEVQAKAAKAIGVTAQTGTWTLTGKAELHGLEQSIEMVFDSQYRFKTAINGQLPGSEGFDGKAGWSMGVSGVSHPASLADLEISKLSAFVMSGMWARKDAPLDLKVLTLDGEAIKVEVKCKGGIVVGTLVVDAKSFLPKELDHWGSEGQDSWFFTDYKKYGGLNLPSSVIRKGGDSNLKMAFKTGVRRARTDSSFAPPKPDPKASSYDWNIKPEVELKRIGGYMFVKPKLNGKDEGWFFFDTGADVMVIDPKVAAKFVKGPIGSDSTAGVVGTLKTDVFKGIDFELGPVKLNGATFIGLDTEPFTKAFGIPVAGVVGYDFMSRVMISIDPKKDTISFYAPGSFSLPNGVNWTTFVFNSNVPSVKCKFEGDRVGQFNLDTGSGSTVDFCSPAVEKLKLLDNRKVTSSMTGGAGGASESKFGKIDWFDFLGKRFDKPAAGFQITKKGVFASPFFDGNIGMGFMGKVQMVFDYANRRLAIIP